MRCSLVPACGMPWARVPAEWGWVMQSSRSGVVLWGEVRCCDVLRRGVLCRGVPCSGAGCSAAECRGAACCDVPWSAVSDAL